MALKRTTVWAEEDDLAVLKAAAKRDGVAEAELIRNAIHLEALRRRRWTDPFFPEGSVVAEIDGASTRATREEVYDDLAADYRRARSAEEDSAR